MDRGSLDVADASSKSFPDSDYQIAANGILWDPVRLFKHVQHNFHFQIVQDERENKKKKKRERHEEGDRISQDKVSYATLLLVLLQVTNYCILISKLPEQEGGGEWNEEGKKEGGKQKSSKIKC